MEDGTCTHQTHLLLFNRTRSQEPFCGICVALKRKTWALEEPFLMLMWKFWSICKEFGPGRDSRCLTMINGGRWSPLSPTTERSQNREPENKMASRDHERIQKQIKMTAGLSSSGFIYWETLSWTLETKAAVVAQKHMETITPLWSLMVELLGFGPVLEKIKELAGQQLTLTLTTRARPGACLLSCLHGEHRGNVCHRRCRVRVSGRCPLRRLQSLTL